MCGRRRNLKRPHRAALKEFRGLQRMGLAHHLEQVMRNAHLKIVPAVEGSGSSSDATRRIGIPLEGWRVAGRWGAERPVGCRLECSYHFAMSSWVLGIHNSAIAVGYGGKGCLTIAWGFCVAVAQRREHTIRDPFSWAKIWVHL
jgi:hypothetical protein